MSESTPLLSQRLSSPPPNTQHLTLPAFFASLAALKANKLPSTPQLLSLIDNILTSSFFDNINGRFWDGNGDGYGTGRLGLGVLSERGEDVRKAVREMLQAAKELVRTKNAENQWQELVEWGRTNEVKFGIDSDAIPDQPLIPTFTTTFQTLFQTLLTSPELRKLLVDAAFLARDFFDQELEKRDDEVGVVGKGIVDEVTGKVTGEEREREEEGKSKEEMRDEFVDRLRAIFLEIQLSPSFRHSLHATLSLLSAYISSLLSTHPSLSSPPPPIHLLNPLLQPFLGSTEAAQPLLASIVNLRQHFVEQNDRVKELIERTREVVERAIVQPGYLDDRKADKDLGEVMREWREILANDPLFKASLQTFFRRFTEVVAAVVEDEWVRDFLGSIGKVGVAMERWTVDAVRLGTGQKSVWGDVVEWLIPRLGAMLSEIPLPRIEFASDDLDIAIDAPPFLHTSFVPDRIVFDTHSIYEITPSTSPLALLSSSTTTTAATTSTTDGRWKVISTEDISTPRPPPSPSPYSINPPHKLTPHPITSREYRHETTMTLTGLRMNTVDIGYFLCYKAFRCFGITERGLLDLHFGKKDGVSGGVDITVGIDLHSGEEENWLILKASEVELISFDIRPHESSHAFLMWLLRPIMRRVLKKLLEEAVRAQVEGLLEKVNSVGKEVRKEKVDEGWFGWLKAAWKVGTTSDVREGEGESGGEVENGNEDDGGDDAEREEEDGEGMNVHVSGKGVSLDLEAGTVGLGAEGIAITTEDSSTPQIPDQPPPNGHLATASQAVRDGKKAAKEVVSDLQEIGEEIEGFEEAVEGEKNEEGWRSDAFDF